MKLIVGLGNPGKTYEKTRHNVGFMIADQFAKELNESFAMKDRFKGMLINTVFKNEPFLILKPLTYMNDSGTAVLAVKQFYNLANSDILVIHDDLDLPCGKLRIRQKGSSGGHNGLKSIISCLNGEDFHRLKVGIDRDELIPVVDYVLGKLSKAEKAYIDEAIVQSMDVIRDWIEYGINYVMNKYNTKENQNG